MTATERMEKTKKQFLDLSVQSDISNAAHAGLLNLNDSSRGFLCTLCGAIVAAKDQHEAYHRGERDFMAFVVNVLESLKGIEEDG